MALLLAGCAATPTVEQANAHQAQVESTCQAKGYKKGSKDFYTCQTLAMQQEQQDSLNTMHATSAAIYGASLLTVLSDARMKEDITPLTKEGGFQLYRFRYKGGEQVYVGVMAQDVAKIAPDAVIRGSDGYLRVNYDRLGLRLMTWEEWISKNKI